jgi:1-acyl-sn-glycerol-3-phosphate acyltransferase
VIRFAWVALVVALATAGYGLIAIGASLLGRRGDIYFWCTQQWGRAVVRASGAPVIPIGLDRIDWSAPHVLVANHISAYDIVALASVLPAPFYFVGKKELNRVPLFGTAWRAAGHVSIDRSNRNRAIASLKEAGRRIRHGRGVIIIFPEGTRSRTGSLQPFKRGAFIMAADAALPVIPTMITGSDRIQPRGTYRVHPGPIEIRFGEPVGAAGFGPDRVDELTETVRARMLGMITSDRV